MLFYWRHKKSCIDRLRSVRLTIPTSLLSRKRLIELLSCCCYLDLAQNFVTMKVPLTSLYVINVVTLVFKQFKNSNLDTDAQEHNTLNI